MRGPNSDPKINILLTSCCAHLGVSLLFITTPPMSLQDYLDGLLPSGEPGPSTAAHREWETYLSSTPPEPELYVSPRLC